MIPQVFLNEGQERGVAALERLMEIVPKGQLFVELQDHGLPEQPILNGMLCEAAEKLGLPLVATQRRALCRARRC